MDNQYVRSLSIRELVAAVARRWKLVACVAAFCLVLGILYAVLCRPVYEASAQVLIDLPTTTSSTVDGSNPLSSLFAINQPQPIDTQAQLLQSLPLLSQVTKEVGKATIDVEPIEGTNVLAVTARASDPQVAAAFANRLVELYIEQDSNRNLDEIDAAIDFLTQQEALARQQLEQSESAIEQFKQKHQLTDLTADQANQLSQVANLTATLSSDKTDLAGIRSEAALTRQALAAEPVATSIKLADTNPDITTLRAQVRALEVQRAGLTQPGGFTAKSPNIMAIDGQIRALNVRLARQPALVTTQSSAPDTLHDQLRAKAVDLDATAAQTAAQIGFLSGTLTKAEARLGHFDHWQVVEAQLTRKRDIALQADSQFTEQLNELTVRAKAEHATATVVQNAYVPLGPIAPKRIPAIIFALLTGLLLGVCLVVGIEFFDDRLQFSSQADQVLRLPVLGHVPMIAADEPRLLPQIQSTSAEMESIRMLRANVLFSAVDRPIRTLLITSPCPGEGKTTLAVNLAYAMAMDGKRVVLVDADLRKPSVSKELDVPTASGLSDVLAGMASIADALMQNTEMPTLHLIQSGPTPHNPSELLNSREFRRFTDALLEEADIVIFDSPPVLATADSLVLASQMDGTMLVVELGQTRQTAATRAISLLTHAKANILGVTYNKMRTGFGSEYTYYGYGYSTPHSSQSSERSLVAFKRASDQGKSHV